MLEMMFLRLQTNPLCRQQRVHLNYTRVLATRRGDAGEGPGTCTPRAGQWPLLFTAGSSGRLMIHTTAADGAKNLINKFLGRSRKKIWYPSPAQGSAAKSPVKRDNKDNSRLRILNSILFKAVYDLLTSAQVTQDLQSFSPEITTVSLAPDFSSCRVFWKSSGESERDQQIQKALDSNSPLIRYLIMSQQIMGGVPPLVFVIDKQHAAQVEVDRLLEQADFGPDPPEASPPYDRPVGGASSARPVFAVNHEMLNRQITEWQQQSKRQELLNTTPPTDFTKEQLSALAEYRKQQMIKKRKKKAPPTDDDITPREFLMARRDNVPAQGEDPEEGGAFKQEEAQLQELMSQDDRRS